MTQYLIERRRLFAERVVEVAGELRAGGVGDQARGSQVVEVVVLAAGGSFSGEELAGAVGGRLR